MYYVIGNQDVGGPFTDTIECDKWANKNCSPGKVVTIIRVFENGSAHFYSSAMVMGGNNFMRWTI